MARVDADRFRIATTVLSPINLRPQLVFTATNWDVEQIVFVSAVDDEILDGGEVR